MPIIICIKEPLMHLLLAGDIKDTPQVSQEYDALFPNLMVKNLTGQNVVIPLPRDCNIAFIKEATDKEIEKMKEEAKKRREAGQGGSIIQDPTMLFPRGSQRRR